MRRGWTKRAVLTVLQVPSRVEDFDAVIYKSHQPGGVKRHFFC